MSARAKRQQKLRKAQTEEQKMKEREKNTQNKRESRDNGKQPDNDLTTEQVKEKNRQRMQIKRETDAEYRRKEREKVAQSNRQVRENFPFRQIVEELQNREVNNINKYVNSQINAAEDKKILRVNLKKYKKQFKKRQKLGINRIEKVLKAIEDRDPVAKVLHHESRDIFFFIALVQGGSDWAQERKVVVLDLLHNTKMPQPRDNNKYYVFHDMIKYFRKEYYTLHHEKYPTPTKMGPEDFKPWAVYEELKDKYENEVERLLYLIMRENPGEELLNYSHKEIVKNLYIVISHIRPTEENWIVARIVGNVAFDQSQKNIFESNNFKSGDQSYASSISSSATSVTDDEASSIETSKQSIKSRDTSESSTHTLITDQQNNDGDGEKQWLNDRHHTYKEDRETMENEMQYYLWDLLAKKEEEKELKEIIKFFVDPPNIEIMTISEKETEAGECVKNGNIFFSKQTYKRAIICYTKALDYIPNYVPALIQRAKANLSIDWFKPAMADVQSVLEIDENNFEAQHLETRVQKKFADALECEHLHDCDMGTNETNFSLGPNFEGVDYAMLIAELRYETSKKQVKVEEFSSHDRFTRDKFKTESAEDEYDFKEEFKFPLSRDNFISHDVNMKVKVEPKVDPE